MRGPIAMLLCLLLGACSVHPLPEDVTGDTTEVIVRKLLCESRDALDVITVELFRQSSDFRYAHRYADEIEQGRLNSNDILTNPKKYPIALDAKIDEMFVNYSLSAVTFDFNLLSMETNDNSFNAASRLPYVNRLFTLDGTAGARLQRQNIQKFQLTSSFVELHGIRRDKCRDLAVHGRNIVYPLVGTIGIEGVFRRFIALDSGDELIPATNRVRQFTEQLQFTTTLSASVSPKLLINPVPAQALRLVDVDGGLGASRTDMHQVTIAIAQGPHLGTPAAKIRIAKLRSLAIADSNRVQNFFFGLQQTGALLGLPPLQ